MLASCYSARIVNGIMTTRGIHQLVQKELAAHGNEASEEQKLSFGEDEIPPVELIRDFLALDVDDLMERPLTDREQDILQRHGFGEKGAPDTKNRRLAMSMLGLEGAVRRIYTARGGSISDEQVVASHAGESTTGQLDVYQANADFGTRLLLSYPTGSQHEKHIATLLPQDQYLQKTLLFGDPHEPVFWASEPDRISPQWSEQERERLPNGGVAHRKGKPITDSSQRRVGIWKPERILYYPLYSGEAPGVERYMRIVQELLARFLDAAGKTERIS